MKRLHSLDFLRSIAILWVLLFHAYLEKLQFPLLSIAKFGWMGVDLFFVLSGYLIGYQLLQNKNWKFVSFYSRRAFRILPAYLVTVAIYSLLSLKYASVSLWKFLTFTQNYFIDYSFEKSFSHAWSLCVEEHFYLFLPLVVWAFKNSLSAKKITCISLVVVLLGMLSRGYVFLYKLTPHVSSGSGLIHYGTEYFDKIYFPTHNRLDGLLAGVLLAIVQFFRPDWLKDGYTHRFFCGGLFGFLLAILCFLDRYSFLSTVVGFPLLDFSFAFLVASALSSKSYLSYWKIPGSVFCASISYSLYLTHELGFYFSRFFFEATGSLALLLYLLSTFFLAFMLFWTIERPFLKVRSLLDRL